MLNIKIICVGKLKEPFYIDGAKEYIKRLGAYCRLEIEELPEIRRPAAPTAGDTERALEKEAELIEERLPKSAYLVAMCIEGKQVDSPGVSQILETAALRGGRLCFVIGGSDGLHPRIKKRAELMLSMSKMTFPHHLARIMLLEQIYRGFKILEGGKYHK